MIYEVQCGNWSKVNISQTGRTLRHRLNEHRRALTGTNLIQSALAKHAASHDHAIDWDSAKVIKTHPSSNKNVCWNPGTLGPKMPS